MSDHRCTAEAWAKAIAKVIKQAEADGYRVHWSEGSESLYVYESDDETFDWVTW